MSNTFFSFFRADNVSFGTFFLYEKTKILTLQVVSDTFLSLSMVDGRNIA